MVRFLARWLILSVALAATAWILPGVHFDSLPALFVGALVLGLLNTVVKPVLVLLTLPLTVLTLGIFYFVLNAILFALAALFVSGFHVSGFGSAFLGALLVGLLSMVMHHATRESDPGR
jgi:putative membrane protein